VSVSSSGWAWTNNSRGVSIRTSLPAGRRREQCGLIGAAV
jgi:hypothetical protein